MNGDLPQPSLSPKTPKPAVIDLLPAQRRTVIRLILSLTLFLGFAGCSSWLSGWIPGIGTATPAVEPTDTAAPNEISPTQTPEDLPPLGPLALHLWVPPQFDPDAPGEAGVLLRARLDEFMETHPDVYVDVRVKSASGPGGLLESLTTASAAAPSAAPALIALSRSDLEAAAVKGLIYPLDELSTAMDDSDWYPYARQLASLQESVFGLPFAGNALALLYRPAKVGAEPPLTWEDVLGRGQPLIFQAGDPQAMVTLTLYRSAGGGVQDAQGRPALNPAILADVFELYQQGSRNGVFPASIAQYQSTGQAWQAYSEGQADWVISWCSNYLGQLPPDTSAALIPPMDSDPLTLATGWVWALSDRDPVRREASIELAEFLVESDFLADLTAAAGYLPTRPSALAAWPNESLQPFIAQVVLSAQLRPANELMASLGPVLLEGTLSILKDQVAPIQAAQTAAEKLGTP
jgi:ABC-type glycerol-3-phosphate transport system substrate-binding protein